MRRLLALVLLVAATAAAQDPVVPQPPLVRVYWGHTGFIIDDTNIYLCKPVQASKGTVQVALDGLGNLTGTNAFVGIVAPDPVPGAAPATFKASAVKARVGGQDYFWNVTSKVSDNSLTVQRGGIAPAESGTPTEWWYWNTFCLMVANWTDITDAQAQATSSPFSVRWNGPWTSGFMAPWSFLQFEADTSAATISAQLLIWRWVLGGATQSTALQATYNWHTGAQSGTGLGRKFAGPPTSTSSVPLMTGACGFADGCGASLFAIPTANTHYVVTLYASQEETH